MTNSYTKGTITFYVKTVADAATFMSPEISVQVTCGNSYSIIENIHWKLADFGLTTCSSRSIAPSSSDCKAAVEANVPEGSSAGSYTAASTRDSIQSGCVKHKSSHNGFFNTPSSGKLIGDPAHGSIQDAKNNYQLVCTAKPFEDLYAAFDPFVTKDPHGSECPLGH